MIGYLPFIRKDFIVDICGLSVYVMEGFTFAQDLTLENSRDSYLCFWLDLLHLLSYFSFLCRSPCPSLCTVFDANSSNIDEVISNHLLMYLSLNTLTFIWTGEPIKMELTDLVNSVTIFLFQAMRPYTAGSLTYSDPCP